MTCKNCSVPLIGKFCHACGQKDYTNKDKSIGSILEEAFHFVTHFEGTFFTTLKAVLFHPGKLSLDYCNGIRKKYYKPISFFMLLIVVYLLFPLMQGMNMEMHYYKNLRLSGPMIAEQIQHKAAELNITEEALGELFHQKSEKASKILLFLLLPLTAAGLYLIPSYKQRRPLYDLFILSTEINTMILLLIFFIVPILYLPIMKTTNIGDEEDAMAPFIIAVLLGYIMSTFKRFYQIGWPESFLRAILFLLFYYVISQIIYKFVLFEIAFLLV